MRLLLDHCVSKRLRKHLVNYEVRTAYEMGWERLTNGRLLDAAQADFDAIITVDRNVRYQQNMAGRSIALIVLAADNNRLETILPHIPQLLTLLPTIQPGQTYVLLVPDAKDE